MKSGFVALIGRSNVGKSTLMNRIIGEKIAITSNKAQTTRNRIQTVYTDERGQVVFVDTPGLHKAKTKLGDYMVNIAKRAIKDVDAILWLVEPNKYIGTGDEKVLEELNKVDVPKILVINKVDTVSRDDILEIIDLYAKRCNLDEIYPISALNGENVDELLSGIFNYIPEGHPFYEDDVLTDQPMKQIMSEYIREKALHYLDDELPHGVTVYIDQMKIREDKSIWDIDATIVCERVSHKGMIIGKQGTMLKKIGQSARYDMEALLDAKVNLKLWVKVKKDWRDSDYLIKNYGYVQDLNE